MILILKDNDWISPDHLKYEYVVKERPHRGDRKFQVMTTGNKSIMKLGSYLSVSDIEKLSETHPHIFI